MGNRNIILLGVRGVAKGGGSVKVFENHTLRRYLKEEVKPQVKKKMEISAIRGRLPLVLRKQVRPEITASGSPLVREYKIRRGGGWGKHGLSKKKKAPGSEES